MITIEVFPAGYGDALLATYGDPASPVRLLIDGGLTGAAKRIVKRLDELDARIDLFVLTHIDTDHIAGAVRLLDTESFAERVRGVWFNGYAHLEQFKDLLGALDGERFSDRIERLKLPWNAGWKWRVPPATRWKSIGGPIVVDGEPVRMPLPGGATAVVLSPDPVKLAELLPVWRTTIRNAGLVDGARAKRDVPDPASRTLLGRASLADVARRESDDDDTEANGSSIAFVLEIPDGAETRRILLTGDAHPDLLVRGLDHLRDGGGRFRVDVCKLPHHGSRRNVTMDFVEALDCQHWIVSTNGKAYDHPNNESLARVIVSNPDSTLYCNYRENQPLASFVKSYPMSRHNYVVERPRARTPGIIVTLGT